MEGNKTKELNYYIKRAAKVGLEVSIEYGDICVRRKGRCMFFCKTIISLENVILVLEDIKDRG